MAVVVAVVRELIPKLPSSGISLAALQCSGRRLGTARTAKQEIQQ